MKKKKTCSSWQGRNARRAKRRKAKGRNKASQGLNNGDEWKNYRLSSRNANRVASVVDVGDHDDFACGNEHERNEMFIVERNLNTILIDQVERKTYGQ